MAKRISKLVASKQEEKRKTNCLMEGLYKKQDVGKIMNEGDWENRILWKLRTANL